jgi:parvulin-like peptidyl-prolyl isomerase
VIFGLQPGHLSGVIRGSSAFHILAMFGREPERPATFEEVREGIERTLVAEKRQRAMERLVDTLRTRAIIERD